MLCPQLTVGDESSCWIGHGSSAHSVVGQIEIQGLAHRETSRIRRMVYCFCLFFLYVSTTESLLIITLLLVTTTFINY